MDATQGTCAFSDRSPQRPARGLRRSDLPAGDRKGAALLNRRVAQNLRHARKARDMTLEQLAAASGVSRAAISQIETHRSNPSLLALCRLSAALGMPLPVLLGCEPPSCEVLRHSDVQPVPLAEGDQVTLRRLSPAGAGPWLEAHELSLAGHARHHAVPRSLGTREILVSLDGEIRVHVARDFRDLGPGDSLVMLADTPRTYENRSHTAVRCQQFVILVP
jgi:transcriptional regulator with XRE-family HTH domain